MALVPPRLITISTKEATKELSILVNVLLLTLGPAMRLGSDVLISHFLGPISSQYVGAFLA